MLKGGPWPWYSGCSPACLPDRLCPAPTGRCYEGYADAGTPDLGGLRHRKGERVMLRGRPQRGRRNAGPGKGALPPQLGLLLVEEHGIDDGDDADLVVLQDLVEAMGDLPGNLDLPVRGIDGQVPDILVITALEFEPGLWKASEDCRLKPLYPRPQGVVHNIITVRGCAHLV